MKCVHCETRPVFASYSKVCKSCYWFAWAKRIARHKKLDVLPEELDGLTIKETARIFGDGWDEFAVKCFAAVTCD